MSSYYCRKGCWREVDLICQNCLLKEISSEMLLETLITRLNLAEEDTIAFVKLKIKQKEEAKI